MDLAAARTAVRADITAATPAEIDTVLSDLYVRLASAQDAADRRWDSLRRVAGAKQDYRSKRWSLTREQAVAKAAEVTQCGDYRARDAVRALAAVERADAEVRALEIPFDAVNDEFDRRGGWTRAFLVTNVNGHVHRSMSCSTCRFTTRYHWVVEMSGHDEAEVVEAAGERACTVCYPSAPVETLARPTRLFTPDEQAAAKARVERDQAKAERAAKKAAKALVAADGSPLRFRVRGYTERFETEVSAVQWAVAALADSRTWRGAMDNDERAGIDLVLDAVAAKHGQTRAEVDAMIEKKVAAKIKRDAR
jgi:hypothetical protein